MRRLTVMILGLCVSACASCGDASDGIPIDQTDIDVSDTLADPRAAQPARGCSTEHRPVEAGRLPAALDEVSGVAVDPRDPSVLWLIEDSGAAPVVVAVGLDGTVRSTVTLDGVRNRDWEDLAAGPCGEATCLYVAEIGDNLAAHGEVRVHRIELPALDADATVPAETMHATWPGGPRDAEALVVFPDETVVILSKEVGAALVAGAPFAANDAPVALADFGTLDLAPWRVGGLVTAADLRDGWLLVRLYADIIAFEVGAAPSALPDALAIGLRSPRELQGESVAWTDDGFVTISEGNNVPIFVARCDDGPP